jgi:hypothetical protein
MPDVAILGGRKARTKPFPNWPMYDELEGRALTEVLERMVANCAPQKPRPTSCGTVFPRIFVMKSIQNGLRSDLTIRWHRMPLPVLVRQQIHNR